MPELSLYHRIFTPAEHAGKAILFSTRTAASLLVPVEMIGEIERGTNSEEERATLVAHGFLVESPEAERREMLGFLDGLAALHRACKPIVVLNLDCNLACTYCFEGTRKGKHYLSEETGKRLLRHLQRHALTGREELGVTFYGGEPLLSLERLRSLATVMRELADAAGIPFHFSLITNGTLLTRDRVEKLGPLGLKSASVTLDGPRETHDTARPYRSGAGSYDVILSNLLEVADLVDLQIGGNFTRENYREFPRLLDDLAAAGLTPAVISQVRFDPVFQEQAGIAPADFHGGCTTFDEPWLCEASVFLREEILRRGYQTGRIMPSRCMMDFPNEPVINFDGAIYPCPGLIGRREFAVGNINITDRLVPRPDKSNGNPLPEVGCPETIAGVARMGGLQRRTEGSTVEVRSDRTPAPHNWQTEKCLACADLPLCFGGCRYMTLLRTGSMAGVDCRKPYFDAVLERLVLQDIRYRIGT